MDCSNIVARWDWRIETAEASSSEAAEVCPFRRTEDRSVISRADLFHSCSSVDVFACPASPRRALRDFRSAAKWRSVFEIPDEDRAPSRSETLASAADERGASCGHNYNTLLA